jgi:hypothetical protein
MFYFSVDFTTQVKHDVLCMRFCFKCLLLRYVNIIVCMRVVRFLSLNPILICSCIYYPHAWAMGMTFHTPCLNKKKVTNDCINFHTHRVLRTVNIDCLTFHTHRENWLFDLSHTSWFKNCFTVNIDCMTFHTNRVLRTVNFDCMTFHTNRV